MTGIYYKNFLFLLIFFIYFFAVIGAYDWNLHHQNSRRHSLLRNLNPVPDLSLIDRTVALFNGLDLKENNNFNKPNGLSTRTFNRTSDSSLTAKKVNHRNGLDLKKNNNNLFNGRGLLSNTVGKIEPLKPLSIFGDVPPLDFNQLLPVVTPQNEADYLRGVKSGDQFRNITQLLEKYGLRTETHYIQTEDGYILTKFRIPSNGPPVFVEHGLLSSSDDFVTLGPEKALAYLLANEGFDVWLGNARGNKHSQRHVTLTPEDDAFWNFSFDEIGRFDHPATIDYILNTTGHEQLYWVGHSQGTTSFFIMCAERPEYNNKVAFMVALSAVAYLGHTTSIGFNLLSPVFQYYDITKALVGPFLPPKVFTDLLKGILCEGTVVQNLICQNAFFVLFGFMNGKTDYRALPVIVGHSPSTISTRQFSHYSDIVESGKFIKFDYKNRNRYVYGTQTPPEYEVEKITVPMAIFQGPADWITGDEDLDLLTRRLRNDFKVYRIPDSEFGHLDFLFAKDAPELLYYDVINVLKNAINNK